MNSISWRHHFIPQFYLDGFTTNGKFKIYDVRNKRFIQNGKDFSPKSYFYEMNGNLLVNDKEADDTLEYKFGKIDDEIAKIFKRINISTSEESFNLSDDDIVKLQYFVSVMYWRNPQNQKEKIGRASCRERV